MTTKDITLARKWCLCCTLTMVIWVTSFPATAESGQVTLPMTIDYPLLNALVRNTFLEGGPAAGVDAATGRKTLLSGSERSFREQWDWVRQDALDKISICLGGR